MALNINGTTGISGVDGSVSAPAVTGTDSNTGITFPSADTIKFSTGGVERMSITNSGVSGGGKILQVKQTYKTDVFSSTSTGTHDITGLSVSITPTSTSSKILVLCEIGGHTHNGMGGSFQIKRTISGSATTIGLADAAGSRQVSSFSSHLYTGDGGGSANIILAANARILDSPSTTSAITYQVVMIQIGTDIYCINRSESDSDNNDFARTVSNITVMEVAA